MVPDGHAQDELPFSPDSVYAQIAGNSEALVGDAAIPETLSVDAWRADFDTLAAVMRRRMPYADSALGTGFGRRLDSLKQALPTQTRDQRILSLMHLLNAPAAGTGHLRLPATQRALGWRSLPVLAWPFDDGTFIMSAADTTLIGRELLAIDGTPIDEVYDVLSPYRPSDNDYRRRGGVAYGLMQWINPLHAAGIADDTASVTLRTRTGSGAVQEVEVASIRPTTAQYVRFRTSPSMRPTVPPDLQWSPAGEFQNNDEPFYRISYRDSTKLLYLQFNTVYSESDVDAFSDLSIQGLADSLRTLADSLPVDKFVVDVRTNTGGDFTIIEPLIELMSTHPKIDRRGSLYVLTSPVSFSATGTFCMVAERRTKAIFAGQPSGFSPRHWGDSSSLLLPNSKISVAISYAYYASDVPGVRRPALLPDLPIPYTSDQHFRNVDATLAAVRRHTTEPHATVELTPAERERFVGTYRVSPLHLGHVDTTRSGSLRLRITGETFFPDLESPDPAVFLDSDLHPLSPTELATDVSGARLVLHDGGALVLDYKGTPVPLSPAGPDATTPLGLLQSGQIDAGADALLAARDAGVMVGNNLLEYPFGRLQDRFIEEGQPEQALRYARASVRLAPASWRTHADVAEALAEMDRPDDARRALEPVRRLAPLQYEAMLQYMDL